MKKTYGHLFNFKLYRSLMIIFCFTLTASCEGQKKNSFVELLINRIYYHNTNSCLQASSYTEEAFIIYDRPRKIDIDDRQPNKTKYFRLRRYDAVCLFSECSLSALGWTDENLMIAPSAMSDCLITTFSYIWSPPSTMSDYHLQLWLITTFSYA